jgi:ATP synthase protein I
MNTEKRNGFRREIGAKARRKIRAQRNPAPGIWVGLGMIGLIGWSVVIPTLLGAALGQWIDRNYAHGHAWTLALLVVGLVLGCAIAWRWVTKEDKEMRKEKETHNE